MRGLVVACDLCELRTDMEWLIRTDRFTVMVGQDPPHVAPGEVLSRFGQAEEWGLCGACKLDVLMDDQAAIMARRRLAAERDEPNWWTLSNSERAAVCQVLDLTVMAVLACRDKAWGRAWTLDDQRHAQAAITRDGQRGKRD